MQKKLTILQLNDLHGYVEPHPEVFRGRNRFYYKRCGGLGRIAAVFKEIRKERPGAVLALDNGDTFHGTYLAVKSKGEALVPLANELGFDAMTLHWEFAYGPTQVERIASQLSYPMLACNIFDRTTGRSKFDSTRVVEKAGLRIGIIGIASNIVDKSMPASYSEGIRFTLGNNELPEHIAKLRMEDRVDLIVVLSHLGFAQDVKLATEVAGIDALISGHTHNRLERPVWVGTTPIIQSGCHGSFIGRLDLTVDNCKVIDVRHKLICIDDAISEDMDMVHLVDETLRPHRSYLDDVIGQVSGPLDRATSLEATMDDVLLKAIASAADTPLAFSNGWRYGAPILPGNVTMEQLWNIVPTCPPVSTVEITGEEIRLMLESNLERTYSADPYCQMGGFVKRCHGLNMYFKAENPKGHRIENLLIGKTPMQPDRLYRAAMLGVQGVPAKYGTARKELDLNAVQALQQLFASPNRVQGRRRGSVVAI